ncbi:hypothetical protein KP509_08G002300 [Ceratopteris richardii]|uniref:Myb/SANT-like DNA-binding domain-containing protein n=1 Tax=Ceratopteris richardii TaxID=49495 RepID=A0A8T2U9C4_CERRI|nr:hypothetical protein KP509_08G002300 [Ceratopteris richardii]KAH7430520.1 hypothetical protein KP509_08G002300 [Ceratopteris richardii]KAH7430523.1 hypothetical protein KP509_08G002300 [Ceratopteris richardii]
MDNRRDKVFYNSSLVSTSRLSLPTQVNPGSIMVSPMPTSEMCLPVKSLNFDGAMLGGTIMQGSSTGRAELNGPYHDGLGGLHYVGQAMQQPHSSASWPPNQHLNDSQTLHVKPLDQHCNAFLLSKVKPSVTSDEDEPSWKESMDEHHCEKGKQASPWHRIKWTDEMIKLLINIVSFVGDDGNNDNLDINKRSILQKKGKWRSVSNVMNEKGWFVSPQQCEDKFNDLNKRYKRLTDILGRDMALQVVDNMRLLDSMTNLSAKRKDDVRKILSSKHSFYKEMHSYHSGFKSPMVADLRIQSVKVHEEGDAVVGAAARSEHASENLGSLNAENREGCTPENPQTDNSTDCTDPDRRTSFLCQTERSIEFSDSKHGILCPNDCKVAAASDIPSAVLNEHSTAQDVTTLQCRLMHLEEMKVNLQAQALELERQYHKWQKINSKRDSELQKLKEENKRMKLENSQLEYQLKQKELEVECKRSVTSMALFDMVLERLRAKEQLESMQGQTLESMQGEGMEPMQGQRRFG